MSEAAPRSSVLLLGAVLLPILYFGVQLALAPTYPNYSFMSDAASLLGSDRSPNATVFNAVAILCGLCGAAGAFGLFASLQAGRCPLVLNLLITLAVLLAAAGCVWAGVFPLPDPRHGANPSAPALIALPLLFAITPFMTSRLKAWRFYFVANLFLMVAMILVMSGVIPVDRAQYGGLLQRILALAGFGPIGVAGIALWLSRRNAVS